MAWEIDWSHPENTGSRVWARKPDCHLPKTRDWHWTPTHTLRTAGITLPTYQKDAWEVDWSRRKGKMVWARNECSKFAGAREWHWVDFHTLNRVGVKWHPKREGKGRWLRSDGYYNLTRAALSEEEMAIADRHGLWCGPKKTCVPEHRLVAVKKFGAIPRGCVVRHLNGDKTDNTPDNLVLGSHQENCWDHETARRMCMFWHNKYDEAQREIAALKARQMESAP